MTIVLEIVLPVFALIFVGWLIVRLGWLDAAGLRGLTNYTFYVAFSALLFRAMRNVRLPDLDADILLAYFGAVAIVWLLAMAVARFVFRLSLPEQAMMALGGTFTNGVGLGIPLVIATWGDAGLVPLLMIIAVHSAILLSAAAVLVEFGREVEDRGSRLRRLASSSLAALRHPVLVAIAVGLLWGMISRGTGLQLPNAVETALKFLAESAVPCGLVGLGASLAMIRLTGDLPQTLVMTVCKLVALPLVVWLLARHVLQLDALWVAVATVNAAMPAGANVYLLAQRYDTYVARTTSTVLLSTVCSIVTLSVVLAIFA
jgi:malonate transporter